MKLADGNKPINVGDPSYIYKGVYNPIYWIGKDPYRPRVETLVIKDGRYVYLNIDDNIDSYPSDLYYKHYSLPGGSLDSDSTKIEQAEAETNEEALIKVTLLYNTGIMYYDLYEPGFILKGGDTPLEYVGSISDIFVGVYDGPFDKSKVDPKDLDPAMAEHGKFHKITEVGKYLRKEHVDALLQSRFISDNVKMSLRLNRTDIINESTSAIVVPDRYIYHASICKIEEFRPMGLDLGNVYDDPGWSTFCFDKYEYARMYGLLRAIQSWAKEANCDINPVFQKGHLIFTTEDFKNFNEVKTIDDKFDFYVYTIDSEPLHIGIGNDKSLNEYTFRESGIKPVDTDSISISLRDVKDCIDIEDEIKSETDNDYSALLTHEYEEEKVVRDLLYKAMDDGDLKPGDDVVKYMEDNGLYFKHDDIKLPDIVCDIDEPVLEFVSDLVPHLMETSYPIECYGLPERKAYPLPDEKHVLSAIRFFNYAKSSEEKQLAKKINEKIKEFQMTDVKVGDKNRFKKYYKPITEQFTLRDYLTALEQMHISVSDISKSDTEKYEIYESMKSLVKMMIHNGESGILGTSEGVTSIIEQCYDAIAEISMNQMNILSKQATSEVPTSTLESTLIALLEADDDTNEEEATDYEAMADEDPDTETGEEDEPTDYEAMADEDTEGDTGTEEEDPTEVNGGDDTTEDEPTDQAEDNEPDTEPAEEEPQDDTDTQEEETPEEGTEPDDTTGEEATDYEAMADEDTEGDTTDDGTEDADTSDDTTDTTPDDTENAENNNRYDNKELKNYFLLNSFLSIHEVVLDVLDSVNGVILPTREANTILAKVVKNLQSILDFVEQFIQFHFNDTDYAFNLYYYNLIISSLKLNTDLLEEAFKDQKKESNKN